MSSALLDQVAALLDELNDTCAKEGLPQRYFVEEVSIIEVRYYITPSTGYTDCRHVDFVAGYDEDTDTPEEAAAQQEVYVRAAIKDLEITDPNVQWKWASKKTLVLHYNV